MQNLKILCLLICFVFSSVADAQYKPQENAKIESRNGVGASISVSKTVPNFKPASKKKFPNIFRPISGFFKRLFGIKPRHSLACAFPTIENVAFSRITFVAECPSLGISSRYVCQSENQSVTVTTTANDPENDVLIYNYEVSAGRIVGNGSKVVWDLGGVEPGDYTFTVMVDDGCGVCGQPRQERIKIVDCSDCLQRAPLCSQATIAASQSTIKEGETITFTANVFAAGIEDNKLKYDWKISSGEIIGGQGTKELTVKVPPESAGSFITASFDIEDDGICEPQTGLPVYVSPE